MIRRAHGSIAALALLVLPGLAPHPARAQPAAGGNHANGLDYQPTPQEVRPRERAAGIAPAPARERAVTDEVERMDRALQAKENADPLLHPRGAGRVSERARPNR